MMGEAASAPDPRTVDTTVQTHRPSTLGTRLTARFSEVSDVGPALLAATVSAVLGLVQLGQPSLWEDESFTARAMSYPYTKLIHEHHWVYYTLMKPWTALAGTSEIALRLPSVVAAASACALLVPLGNRLMGRPVGSIAGIVLALNPFVVQWSQQARSYALVTAVAVAATWALVHLRGERTTRSWCLYTVALGALVLVQPLSAGLLWLAHLLAAHRIRTRILAAGVAVAILASPFLLGVYRRDSQGGTLMWNGSPSQETVMRALLELSGALGVGLILTIAAIVFARRERLLLASWAVVPFAVSLAVTPVAEVFIDRYLIISAPAFAVLVAAAIDRLRGPWRIGAVGTFMLGTIGGLLIWYAPTGSQNWVGQDWKAATTFAMQHGGATVEPPWAASAYEYYGGVLRDNGLYLVLASHGSSIGDSPLDRSFGGNLRIEVRR